jgi:VWFA-related protein
MTTAGATARPRRRTRSAWSGALRLCPVLATLLVSTPGLAQNAQPRPTFRGGVELVTADVTVVDGDGRPVKDLEAGDFTVRVDGAPRAIVSLQFVDLAPAAPREIGVPAPLYATNELASSGRLVAFVVDQGNIRTGRGRSALAAAGRFLDSLSPADRAAFFSIPPPGQAIAFTNDFGRVRDALSRAGGRASPIEGSRFALGVSEALSIVNGDRQTLQDAVSRLCGGQLGCDSDILSDAATMVDELRSRSFATLTGLETVVAALATIDGPKTVVLISEGMVMDQGLAPLADLAAAAATARVSLYALRLESGGFDVSDARPGSVLGSDSRLMAEGLETLAGLARGAVFTVTGSGAGIFDRVARELSGHYLLAFEPGPNDRDGKPHQVRVDVRRPGVTVRSRREFRATAAAAPPSTEETLVRTLSTPMVRTELPIRLSPYVFAGESADKVQITLSAEIGRDRIGAEEVGLAYSLADASGRIVASGLQKPTLMTASADRPGPLLYRGSVVSAPGDYTLRFAAVDSEGHVGSLDRPLRARLVDAKPLRLGDLALGERSSGSTFVLPAVPRVGPGSVVAYLELYGEREDDLDAALVSIELAESEAAPPLIERKASVSSQHAPTRRTASAEIDVRLLPPGRYVARARVSVGGRPAGVVTRPFELAAAEPAATEAARAVPVEGDAVAAAAPIDVRTMAEPFRRDVLLAPDMVRVFLDELVSNLKDPLPERLAPAVDEARDGHFADAASKAKEPRLHPVATFLRGLDALERGDRQGASNLFRSTLQAARGSYAAMVYLGACYADGGRDDEAIGAWQTSLLGFENAPLVYALAIDAALRWNDVKTARATLGEAMGLWPDDARFIRRAALVALATGHRGEAVTAFDRILASQPDDEPALRLALQAIYQIATAGGVIESVAEDLARARRYAAAYERIKGAQQALVRTWLTYLERRQ